MFLHLSVSHSVHRGLCIPTCNRQESVHPTWADTPLGRHPHPPAPRRPLKRVVHILLEWILVHDQNSMKLGYSKFARMGQLDSLFHCFYWLKLELCIYSLFSPIFSSRRACLRYSFLEEKGVHPICTFHWELMGAKHKGKFFGRCLPFLYVSVGCTKNKFLKNLPCSSRAVMNSLEFINLTP